MTPRRGPRPVLQSFTFFLTSFWPAMPSATRTARPRLATLMTAGVSATVLVTVLSLLVLVDHFAFDYAEREAGQRLQQLSWQMRDALNRVVQKATGDVALLTALPQIRDA